MEKCNLDRLRRRASAESEGGPQLSTGGWNLQDDDGNVVVATSSVGEDMQALEQEVERLARRHTATTRPSFRQLRRRELDALAVARLMKPVAGKQNAVAGRERYRLLIVAGKGKHA